MTNLGHVVFYVRELERSVKFYTDIVGLELKGSVFNNRAAVLSGGSTHHELLLIEVGEADGPMQGHRIGLYHTGWCVGNEIATLKKIYDKLLSINYPLDGLSDHTVSQSIYLRDPDGNEVELFVDDLSFDWMNDDSWMEEPVKPLVLG